MNERIEYMSLQELEKVQMLMLVHKIIFFKKTNMTDQSWVTMKDAESDPGWLPGRGDLRVLQTVLGRNVFWTQQILTALRPTKVTNWENANFGDFQAHKITKK